MTLEIIETGSFIVLTALGWLFALKMSKGKYKVFFIILAVFQVLYSIFFSYQLAYNSSGGMALVWGLYFIFFNMALTLLLLLIALLFVIRKRKHSANK